jgi:ribosomal protein S18 acetylase RimI-like enzyme
MLQSNSIFSDAHLKIRIASGADNDSLLELASSASMDGDTSLRIERYPDFFSLLKYRGESIVFVAEGEGKITGCISLSLQDVFVDGEIHQVYYIGDLKVLPQFRGYGIAVKLCNAVQDYLEESGADLLFTTVAKGNKKPIPFLEKRNGMSDFLPVGIFKIYQLIGKRKISESGEFKIERAGVSNEIIEIFNASSKKYSFGNVITKEKLNDTEIYTIREKNKITGAIAIFDTMHIKQNIPVRISRALRLAITLSNAFHKLTGISRLPVEGEAVEMLYIKYIAATNSNCYRLLIDRARRLAFDRSYSFVSLGLHERDEKNKLLNTMLKIKFEALGFFTSLKKDKDLIEKINNAVPFEDYSLV